MPSKTSSRLSTGIDGLDTVLHGGLIPNRTYMLRGAPGAGKTLFGLHFLLATTETDENGLFIALEESAPDIRQNAASIGLDLSEISILDLSPGSEFFVDDQAYDIFASEEVEDDILASSIMDHIEELEPSRVVLDPASQLRYLAPDAYQFRKQILSFIQFLRERDATVLFTSQAANTTSDDDLQFLSDGVINLTASGGTRTLSVQKFRGSDAMAGSHDFRITDTGVAVYPELLPGKHSREFSLETVSSGVPEIDELLGGGIERGTVTIISGPTGVGKSTLGTQFMKEAAGRGERSVTYLFEENQATFIKRSLDVNLPVDAMLDRGTLSIKEIEPLQRSAAEIAQDVRQEVEGEDAKIIMIDGVDGYRLSLRGETDNLTRKLHSLCRYLKGMGVAVILIDETGAITGEFMATSESISYLADSIVFIRYLELNGELRKAIGVLKKRTSDFERNLREYEITHHGLKVGEPLSELRGILKGTPEWITTDSQNRD